jgi:hypothetical protein
MYWYLLGSLFDAFPPDAVRVTSLLEALSAHKARGRASEIDNSFLIDGDSIIGDLDYLGKVEHVMSAVHLPDRLRQSGLTKSHCCAWIRTQTRRRRRVSSQAQRIYQPNRSACHQLALTLMLRPPSRHQQSQKQRMRAAAYNLVQRSVHPPART